MVTDPTTILTPLQALDAAVRELGLVVKDLTHVDASPEALMALYYATEVIERLRDNVSSRAKLPSDTFKAYQELRGYCADLEDRLLIRATLEYLGPG